jgi:hypothetical protein
MHLKKLFKKNEFLIYTGCPLWSVEEGRKSRDTVPVTKWFIDENCFKRKSMKAALKYNKIFKMKIKMFYTVTIKCFIQLL